MRQSISLSLAFFIWRSKRRHPISLHGKDVCHPRQLFHHAEEEDESEERFLSRQRGRGEDQEPERAGEENCYAVCGNSEEERTETGRGMINPAPKGGGEEEDADGFGNATRNNQLTHPPKTQTERTTYFIEDAVRFPGKAD